MIFPFTKIYTHIIATPEKSTIYWTCDYSEGGLKLGQIVVDVSGGGGVYKS